jgi:hypothetical protein
VPLAWWIGRICEEFPAYTPETAWRAWRTAPAGFFEELIEMRAFAAVHRQYRAGGGDRKKLPDDSALADLVQQFEFEDAERALKER